MGLIVSFYIDTATGELLDSDEIIRKAKEGKLTKDQVKDLLDSIA